jgi:hypothetical protein
MHLMPLHATQCIRRLSVIVTSSRICSGYSGSVGLLGIFQQFACFGPITHVIVALRLSPLAIDTCSSHLISFCSCTRYSGCVDCSVRSTHRLLWPPTLKGVTSLVRHCCNLCLCGGHRIQSISLHLITTRPLLRLSSW